MKNLILCFVIIQLFSCVSSKKVAESRNSEFAAHNSYELFKIWREIDILRFNRDILNVKIALFPEDKTLHQYQADSQLVNINDSLRTLISEKMNAFNELRETYFDTTDQERVNIFQNLKSDSSDYEFLGRISDSPYYDLYENILMRMRNSIQNSTFYASRQNFEEYIMNRSIEIADMDILRDVFGEDTLSVKSLSKAKIFKLKESQIDFIISFSGSYNLNYSDRARGRIGSERIDLILYDVHSSNQISGANITYFWGSE